MSNIVGRIYRTEFDPLFTATVISASPSPQAVAWIGMHTCYSEDPVRSTSLSEQEAGELVVKHLLKGDRGHYSPLEHNSISLSISGFPHSVMQQLTRHRVGVSFSVQSGRYTGQRIAKLGKDWQEVGQTWQEAVNNVFYLRPVGEYSDRSGKRYLYTEKDRATDLDITHNAAVAYALKLRAGYAEEHARGCLPYDIRQNFVATYNARSLMHTLDLRAKADAQEEIQQLSYLLFKAFSEWMPEVAAWYAEKRLGKAKLAP